MISLSDAYSFEFNKAKKLIEREDFFRAFSHYDADGVASGLIIAETLRRKNKNFHLSFVRSVDAVTIQGSDEHPTILSDLGSDMKEGINKRNTIVIDHHMMENSELGEAINLNPRRFGFDGTKEACSSTVAFLLSTLVDEGNSDLFPAFIAGVIGDKQNVGGFRGINGSIVESLKNKYPSSKDLNLMGKTVSEAIFLSIEPYFDGLSGNLEASRYFLQRMNIDPDAPIANLRTDEKEKIVDALTMQLIKQNTAREGYETLVSDVFNFRPLGLSGGQLSDYFDASGRSGRMGLPTSWFMGNEDAKEEMDSISTKLRKEALDQIKTSIASKKELENVHVVYVENPYLAGITASIFMVYLAKKKKPVVALHRNRDTKVSGRATRDLVAMGVDLSKAISEAASAAGGKGGGHDIAAGGEIPFDREEEFLRNLNEALGKQLVSPEKSAIA